VLPKYVYFYLKFAKPIAERLASGTTFLELSGTNAGKIPIPLPPLAEQRRIVAQVELLLARTSTARDRLARVPAILRRFRQSVLAAACSGQLTAEWRADREDGADGSSEDLPSTWEWRSAGDLYLDARYGTSVKCDRGADGGIPVLRIPNIVSGRVDLSDIKYAHEPASDLRALFLHEGDLVVCRTNGSLDLIGKTAVVPQLPRLHAFASYLIRLRLRQQVLLPEYLHTCLSSRVGRDHIEKHARTTAGQFNLNLEILRTLPVPLPSVVEQHEIVRCVGALFGLADRIEQHVGAGTLGAEKLSQAALAKAFRGELVPTEAELARQEGRDYESAADLLERVRQQRLAHPSPKVSRRSAHGRQLSLTLR